MNVSAEILRALLAYDENSGTLTWKHRYPGLCQNPSKIATWNSKHAGKEAFTSDCGAGYRQGSILGKLHRAHRVIWAIAKGEWPEYIDHINGDRSDNRLCNLRAATASENCCNSSVRKHNKLGVKGVKRWGKRYCATIRKNGVIYRIGVFDTIEQAAEAYAKASVDLHGAFSRTA